MSDLEQIGPDVRTELLSLIERSRADAYEEGRKVGVVASEQELRRQYERGRESGLRDLQNSAHKEYDRGFNDGITQEREMQRADARRYQARAIEDAVYRTLGCSREAVKDGVRREIGIAARNIRDAMDRDD